MTRRMQVLLVSAIVFLTISVVGIGAYLVLGLGPTAYAEGAPAAAAPAASQVTAPPAFYTLANFVTDLADRDRARFVSVTVSLAMKDENAVADAKKLEPQIRDTILGRLRVLVAGDLTGAKGKEQLAATLQTALSDLLKEKLTKVYVTDLTVQ